MVQSPSWEADWFAASQEFPRILWNPNFYVYLLRRKIKEHTKYAPICKYFYRVCGPS